MYSNATSIVKQLTVFNEYMVSVVSHLGLYWRLDGMGLGPRQVVAGNNFFMILYMLFNWLLFCLADH